MLPPYRFQALALVTAALMGIPAEIAANICSPVLDLKPLLCRCNRKDASACDIRSCTQRRKMFVTQISSKFRKYCNRRVRNRRNTIRSTTDAIKETAAILTDSYS